MAPARTRKPKASPSDTASTRSRVMTIKSPARTPISSPSKGNLTTRGITASQKQALIDNLQLEVTERARKLRAQYALQAQSLRTRIEMRINRIPSGLRKMKMGELYEKYMQMDAASKSQVTSVSKQVNEETDQNRVKTASQRESLNSMSDAKRAATESNTVRSVAAPPSRGTKRTSEMFDSDKENPTTTTTSTGPKPIPNKKQRAATKDSSHPSHQNPNPSTVLSPKSANSRTLPSRHVKGGEPLQKNQYSIRPTSPLKGQTSPVKTKVAASGAAAKSAATSTLAKTMGPPPQPQTSKPRGRKAAAAPAMATSVEIHDEGSIRTVSSASNASTGTTIVKKASGEGAKRGGAKTLKTTGKKTPTVAVGEDKTGTKGGRRVLRKR